ncbi:SpoIIE family protein phosphatase [Streptomyces sp. NBS 14/10]|uniref:ATP-binding SpoIIE family protein phosphatase n=1 Tax=Streptomyces sp. NBS 14/10 TaxID=1945643 RepID=UPI000B7EE404|nr:SpoIIE family protein phosphatase [Streptomyces sp. NBS 14/10]KAK1184703.1 SpoIIE family protein phosphatase [Streptomyces sp. NBS 14/10]
MPMRKQDSARSHGRAEEFGHQQVAPLSAAIEVDARGYITAWGPDAARLLGYQPGDMLGHPVLDLLAGELPASARSYLRAQPGDGWSGPIKARHQGGHRVQLAVQAHPLTDARGGMRWLVVAGTAAEARPGRPGPEPGAPGWPEEELSEEERLLENWTLAQMPIPVAIYNTRARLVGANVAMTHLMGQSVAQMRGLRLREMDSRPIVQEIDLLQEQVIRTGEAIRHEGFDPLSDEPSKPAWAVYLIPVKDAMGVVRGLSAVVFDYTEQHRARRRLTIVNEASVRIGTTLDVSRTAQELADVAVDRFADFVTVDLLDAIYHGQEPMVSPASRAVDFRRIAQQSVLEDCPEASLVAGGADSWPEYSPPAKALAAGRGVRHSTRDEEIRRWTREVPRRGESVHRYGIHSVMAVPLIARGTTLGVAMFYRHRTRDPFDDDDLLLAEEITARAAVCVDNARRYTRERAVSLAIQRSMLPRTGMRQMAASIASRYLPARTAAGVGGDWFDVIRLSGARIALVVGDVVGHGVHAVATMGRLRTAVRTLADIGLPPDELLTHLDDLVLRLDEEEFHTGETEPRTGETEPRPQTGDLVAEERKESTGELGATCLYGVYDPITRTASFASAGHPAPVVVTPGGAVTLPRVPPGPPLGVGGLPFETVDMELPENSTLVLYTDGLLRSAARDPDEGLALLCRALTEPGESAEQMCQSVLDVLTPERGSDDIALLIARTRTLDAASVATRDVPATAATVAEARRWTSRQLTAWGLEEAIFTTELVVSELVTNAIRHASSPIQLRLIHDAGLICEVSDASSTAPHMRRARSFDEGGRGLLLVAQLTQRWGTRQTPHGKVIWAEQSLPPSRENGALSFSA